MLNNPMNTGMFKTATIKKHWVDGLLHFCFMLLRETWYIATLLLLIGNVIPVKQCFAKLWVGEVTHPKYSSFEKSGFKVSHNIYIATDYLHLAQLHFAILFGTLIYMLCEKIKVVRLSG